MERPFPPCAGVRHRYHQVATGIRLHVAEAGPPDGRSVVLLHGWPQHWWCWRDVIPPLADAGFRVIAPDLRGAGWSDAPAHGYEKEQLASDVLALLDTLALERVALVGHDWGGWVAQLVALRAPQRVERLTLCNIAPVWSPGGLTAARDAWRLAYQPLLAAPGLGPALHRRPRLRLALPGVPAAAQEEFLAALREPGHAEASSAYYRTFLRSELVPLARGRYDGLRLTMPTLVLHGTRDPAIRPRAVRTFAAHADRLELVWLPDAGHFVVDERPLEVARRLRGWFTKAWP